MEYSLKKVGCKALIMSEKYKSQNFTEMFSQIVPEIEQSSSGSSEIKSKRLPELKSAILIGQNKQKFSFSSK